MSHVRLLQLTTVVERVAARHPHPVDVGQRGGETARVEQGLDVGVARPHERHPLALPVDDQP